MPCVRERAQGCVVPDCIFKRRAVSLLRSRAIRKFPQIASSFGLWNGIRRVALRWKETAFDHLEREAKGCGRIQMTISERIKGEIALVENEIDALKVHVKRNIGKPAEVSVALQKLRELKVRMHALQDNLSREVQRGAR
jgi:hypothetical protein